MSVNNWKLWLFPFGAWGLVMAWFAGYQSGYHEGHETAWLSSRGNQLIATDDQTVANTRPVSDPLVTK